MTAVAYTCTRCGGSGKYSFNLIHGTKCYGCNGTGKQAKKPTPKMPRFAILFEDRLTGERVCIYSVKAKTAEQAVEKSLVTSKGASAEFKLKYDFENVTAVLASELGIN